MKGAVLTPGFIGINSKPIKPLYDEILFDNAISWGTRIAKEKGITRKDLRDCLAEVRKTKNE